MKKVLFFVLFFMFAVVLAGCGETITIDITMVNDMAVGETYDLNAKVEGVELSKVQWKVSNNEVAAIENGKLVTKAEGSFTLTASYKNVEASLDITVKALYTITYDTDEGVLDGTEVKSFADPSKVVLPVPKKPGYSFVGWYEDETKVETLEAKNYSLVAHWEIAEVKMNYVKNGGSFNGTLPETRTVEKTIKLPKGSKPGYTFIGWFANADFSGEEITKLNETNIEVTTVYAKFEANQLPIAFELNGGTCENLPTSRTAEDTVTLPAPTREGYDFAGWYENEDFTGDIVEVLNADNYNLEKLYAKWEVKTFTVKYVLNNVNASMAETTVTKEYFDEYNLEEPTFNSEWYNFKGWFNDEQLTETVTSFTKKEGTFTVYAKWEDLKNIVTYELNGGSFKYASRAEVVADFITDWNDLLGKTLKLDGSDVSTGSWDDTNLYTLFAKDRVLEDGTTVNMFDKWEWLIDYLYQVSKQQLASNNCNYLGLKQLKEQRTVSDSGDNKYGVTYAFRAFLAGAIIRPGTAYKSVDFSNSENANGFWNVLGQYDEKVFGFDKGSTFTLVAANREKYTFGGWYENSDLSGDPITTVNETKTVYAKWLEPNPVTKVSFTNAISELERFKTYQLTWSLEPTEPTIDTVTFSSSDESIATVSDKGLITAVSEGKVTITITSKSQSGASATIEIDVYAPDYFKVSYETESYVEAGKTIKLNAEIVKRDKSTATLEWATADSNVATVVDGVVTGVAAGNTVITVIDKANPELKFEFGVTVLSNELSDVVKFVIANNQSNAFTRYQLGIGSGTPAYYADITGSFSNILFNHTLVISDMYKEKGDATEDYYANSVKDEGLEFITVHYTAGFDASADTDNHASYFTNGTSGTSIHYVTGNPGDGNNSKVDGVNTPYEIFSTLSHDHGAWHAGDSNARYYSNSNSTNTAGEKIFEWKATGVKAPEGTTAEDLVNITWTASDDFYFEINGQKTTIKLPDTYNYKSRNTDHKYNDDGTISSQTGFVGTAFEDRDPESFFNSQGFPVTIIDGEYYMGPTWWSYGQVTEGRICGTGGNRNSIGIESCCNSGSDLWYTWQVTAQLVASLMDQYDLDISRVKGHHFFDGKDCPQPMLENDLEIWWEFLELVKAEYEVITTYKDYTFACELVGEDVNAQANGRFFATTTARTVTYKVTITNTKDNSKQEIVLSSLANSLYCK